MKKIITTIAFAALFLFFYLFNTNYRVHNLASAALDYFHIPGSLQLTSSVGRIFNSLDPSKVLSNLPDGDVLNLELSYDDIKSFDESYNSCSSFFLSDECKPWRKAKFKNMEFEGNIKVKLSGTSRTPYNRSTGFGDLLYKKFIDKNSIYNPVLGGYSYVVKFKKDNIFNNMSKVSLLSPYDDWSYFQQVLNMYARQYGLITAYGRPYVLQINGIDSGVYLLQERIDKDLLERDYGITNYAILKSSDEWDSVPQGHQNNTDYETEDKEQAGSSQLTISIAQSQLRRLFDALKARDLTGLGRFLDFDYMAKISAFEMIYGSYHSSIGDNRRYIYNLANGKFYPSFRMEGNPQRLQVSQNVIPKIQPDYEPDKFLDLLSTDPNFVKRRDFFLAKFMKDKEEVIDLFEQYSHSYGHLLTNSKQPTSNLKMRNNEGIDNYIFNISLLEKYFSYNKIYITKILDGNKCDYTILVDSYATISLDNEDLKLENGRSNMLSDKQCSLKMNFRNEALDINIPEKYIHQNIELKYKQPQGFEKYFSYTDDGNSIRIEKGNYYVLDDIEFPIDRGVVIESGTTISIADQKSILFHNDFTAVGTDSERITIRPMSKSFGSILIKANNQKVRINNLHVNSGNESVIDNTFASGQFVVIHADVDLKNSVFSQSHSDDGINIKYSTVNLVNNLFTNNFGDQIDLDYCSGKIIDNSFVVDRALYSDSERDGLDVSGSNILVKNNYFSGLSDKAISVGEKSKLTIMDNIIEYSNIGVAVKDGSSACLSNNKLDKNVSELTGYIKKKMYQEPRIYFVADQKLDTLRNAILVDNCNDFE